MSIYESPNPFFYTVPTQENGTKSFEIRYAFHASSLMTVDLEAPQKSFNEADEEDTVDPLELSDADESSPNVEDVVSIHDSSDEDAVEFVSEEKTPDHPEWKTAKLSGSQLATQKPCNVVKPFGFSKSLVKNQTFDTEEVVVLSDDEDEDEEYYRGLFKKFQEIDCGSSEEFTIHGLCDNIDPVIKSEPVSEKTIRNYSGCKREWLSDDSNDPLYVPSESRYGKKRRSSSDSNDPTFIPDTSNGPTRDLSVYQTVPLNRFDTNRSRITYCDRIIDYVETVKKSNEEASVLCRAFWESLSIRTKRKYLPRSVEIDFFLGPADFL
ncbi:hypothetical protein GE061_004499 [Apolygus lucorum]|uniref:Uncharacterized protein n=1 Tax=Apolygus lucorum TaxID=248454 RepID=A0A8S9X1B4_APOLU|nr:hypothetical protein GE061_004499 [Apolygus lucorum]